MRLSNLGSLKTRAVTLLKKPIILHPRGVTRLHPGGVKYDAIVLGAGIAGLSSALALAKRGKKVLLLGRKGLRGESSPAAAGILDPLLEMKPSSPLLKLSLEAHTRYPAFIRDLAAKTHRDVGYAKTGLLYGALSDSEGKILRERYQWQKKKGFPVRWMSADAARSWQPSLSSRLKAALFYPTIAKVHPAKLMASLSQFARKEGVRILKFSEEKDIRLEIRDKKVTGVRVQRNFFHAPAVIHATGSWAGADSFLKLRLPVIPARGQILVLRGPLAISTILHSLDGAYIVPWKKNRYLIGSTVEFVGFKPQVTAQGMRDILRRVEALAPAVRRLKRVTSWAGLRPFSEDKLPLIGPTPIRGLYLATGYYRSGILIGPYVGNLLAKGILSGKMPFVLTPFSPMRFQK